MWIRALPDASWRWRNLSSGLQTWLVAGFVFLGRVLSFGGLPILFWFRSWTIEVRLIYLPSERTPRCWSLCSCFCPVSFPSESSPSPVTPVLFIFSSHRVLQLWDIEQRSQPSSSHQLDVALASARTRPCLICSGDSSISDNVKTVMKQPLGLLLPHGIPFRSCLR